jgi:hypothetical protein
MMADEQKFHSAYFEITQSKERHENSPKFSNFDHKKEIQNPNFYPTQIEMAKKDISRYCHFNGTGSKIDTVLCFFVCLILSRPKHAACFRFLKLFLSEQFLTLVHILLLI